MGHAWRSGPAMNDQELSGSLADRTGPSNTLARMLKRAILSGGLCKLARVLGVLVVPKRGDLMIAEVGSANLGQTAVEGVQPVPYARATSSRLIQIDHVVEGQVTDTHVPQLARQPRHTQWFQYFAKGPLPSLKQIIDEKPVVLSMRPGDLWFFHTLDPNDSNRNLRPGAEEVAGDQLRNVDRTKRRDGDGHFGRAVMTGYLSAELVLRNDRGGLKSTVENPTTKDCRRLVERWVRCYGVRFGRQRSGCQVLVHQLESRVVAKSPSQIFGQAIIDLHRHYSMPGGKTCLGDNSVACTDIDAYFRPVWLSQLDETLGHGRAAKKVLSIQNGRACNHPARIHNRNASAAGQSAPRDGAGVAPTLDRLSR